VRRRRWRRGKGCWEGRGSRGRGSRGGGCGRGGREGLFGDGGRVVCCCGGCGVRSRAREKTERLQKASWGCSKPRAIHQANKDQVRDAGSVKRSESSSCNQRKSGQLRSHSVTRMDLRSTRGGELQDPKSRDAKSEPWHRKSLCPQRSVFGCCCAVGNPSLGCACEIWLRRLEL